MICFLKVYYKVNWPNNLLSQNEVEHQEPSYRQAENEGLKVLMETEPVPQ